MASWLTYLHEDPIPWLLDTGGPSVRYRVLTDLLGRPANDPEVQAARAAVNCQPLVQEIFAAQHAAGHWGDDPAKPYTASGTLGALQNLYLLGVEPDDRTTAGCRAFLCYSQHESGGFSMSGTGRSGIFPCTTGEHLPMLVAFGMAGDERVRRAWSFLVADTSTADALVCARYQHRPCLWGAIATLKGLAVLPEDLRSPYSTRVVHSLVDVLLDARYDFAGEHKRWLTFGVPRGWDLLSALGVLAAHGFASDARFTPLLDLVLDHQDTHGRWTCGSNSRTWPLERRNQPSTWVTLDALRLLNMVAEDGSRKPSLPGLSASYQGALDHYASARSR